MTATLADQTMSGEAKYGAPTVEMAAAASEAIAQSVPGVRRICLYGSVARGKASPEQVTDLLMETLRSQTPGGTIRGTPIVNRYCASVEEMRTLRRDHDVATGRQRYL